MKAPSSSHTKFPLPQFRTSRLALLGAGFLLASCSESITQPGERAPARTAPAWQPTPDVVIMERMTVSAARDGETPVIHTSRQVLTPQLRIAGRTAKARASASPNAAGLPAALLIPTLSLPARREVAICSALPSWTERTKGADGRAITLAGIGDAPATTIKLTQPDGSVLSIERHWTRTASTWQLDRQVTTGANGFRDAVTFSHQGASGKLLNNAIPVSGCTGQQALIGQASATESRSFYAPYSPTLYSKLVPRAGVFADEGCWSSSGDPCFDKRLSVYKADIALAVAAAGVTLACLPPAVVTVGPCAVAVLVYTGAVANLYFEKASYQNCLEEQRSRLPTLSVGVDASPLPVGSVGGRSLVTLVPHTAAASSCGSSGPPISSTSCHWDTWEITYDGGETWEFFATFLICDDLL